MMNQVVLIGRMTQDVETKEENGKEISVITIAVSRQFKNENGEYDTDLIPVIIWGGIATNVKEYCRKGDLMGIRGRLQVESGNIQVIAEKVTFLSSKKSEEE